MDSIQYVGVIFDIKLNALVHYQYRTFSIGLVTSSILFFLVVCFVECLSNTVSVSYEVKKHVRNGAEAFIKYSCLELCCLIQISYTDTRTLRNIFGSFRLLL